LPSHRLPFEEAALGGLTVRKFSSAVDDEELAWHRDREDRRITVIESEGWFFQRDGELPMRLEEGSSFFIEKNSWHRIIKKKASGDLIVLIQRII
jgi:quercetin dioxygenase-like cupin family protein